MTMRAVVKRSTPTRINAIDPTRIAGTSHGFDICIAEKTDWLTNAQNRPLEIDSSDKKRIFRPDIDLGLCTTFSWGLTPELSRPVAGRRARASVAQSTWPMPRHGVGLNDLLGGTEARDTELRTSWPKTEARTIGRAPRTSSRPSPKQRLRRGEPADDDRSFRSQRT
jgi:hypothetical protein